MRGLCIQAESVLKDMVLNKGFPFSAECTRWQRSQGKMSFYGETILTLLAAIRAQFLSSIKTPRWLFPAGLCLAGWWSLASHLLPHWVGQVPAAENSLWPECGPSYCHGDSQLLLSTSLGTGHKERKGGPRMCTVGCYALLEALRVGRKAPGGLGWVCFLRARVEGWKVYTLVLHTRIGVYKDKGSFAKAILFYPHSFMHAFFHFDMHFHSCIWRHTDLHES